MAPSYANIFMDHLERQMLANMDVVSSTWWRYIDDTFAIWPHSGERLVKFLKKRETKFSPFSIHGQVTAKLVSFLNMKVTADNEGYLTANLQVKPTDTHQYLHKDSCHPSHCKWGIPYSQAFRIQTICSRTQTICGELRNWRASWLIRTIIRMRYNNNLIGHLGSTGVLC